jgi:hypothetical protein
MKYSKLCHRFAKWLFPLIDPYDWGAFSAKKQKPMPAYTNDKLNAYYGKRSCAPPNLTRTRIERQLDGSAKLYYTSLRKSGFALLCIDVDAHNGQSDALETALYIRDAFFRGAFLEASQRGYHLYTLARVGLCTRKVFNAVALQLESNLNTLVEENGFTCPVEVLGRFTLVESNKIVEGARAKPTPMPHLYNREADMSFLEAMPIFLRLAFQLVDDAAEAVRECQSTRHDTHTSGILEERVGSVPRRDSSCAWERMQWACFDYTVVYRSLPSIEELLSYYQTVYGGDASKERIARAKAAIKYRGRTFDSTKASEGGYETQKAQLLEAVRQHCVDRTAKYEAEITDEDLAIALFVVQCNSFRVYDDERQQWSCPRKAFGGMFQALQKQKLTKRGCSNLNKSVALKVILQRSGLIECVDADYVHGEHFGVGKKYTIGPTHWRYQQFCRWSENIKLVLVKDLAKIEIPISMLANPVTVAQEMVALLA